MADISKVKTTGGVTYNIKDAQARTDIETIMDDYLTSADKTDDMTSGSELVWTSGGAYTELEDAAHFAESDDPSTGSEALVWLSDRDGNLIAPANFSDNVFMPSNESLQDSIDWTYEDVRDETDCENKLPGAEAVQDVIKIASNPNLLDNGWFQINQRSITPSTWPKGGYGLDRWVASNNATITTVTNGVSASVGGFYQRLESERIPYGKEVTISAILNGTVYSGTFTVPAKGAFPVVAVQLIDVDCGGGAHIYSFAQQDGSGNEILQGINITTAGKICTAAKLELGKHSTLANDSAPNVSTELLKCQRYFYIFSAHAGYTDGTRVNMPVDLPIMMRTTPTIKLSSPGSLLIQGTDHKAETGYTVSATCLGYFGQTLWLRFTTSPNFATSRYYPAIWVGTMELSADL